MPDAAAALIPRHDQDPERHVRAADDGRRSLVDFVLEEVTTGPDGEHGDR
jgi:hypothetical protein